MNDFEQNLLNFIEKWGVSDYLANQSEFVDNFLIVMRRCDDEDFMFDGRGSYFGKQVTLRVGSHYNWDYNRSLSFEIAYDDNNIVVYTSNNGGYWVAPYIAVNRQKDDVKFKYINLILKEKLMSVFGL